MLQERGNNIMLSNLRILLSESSLRLPQGRLGESQAQMLESLWFPSLHGLLIFPHEKKQRIILHGKPKEQFLRYNLDVIPEEKNT